MARTARSKEQPSSRRRAVLQRTAGWTALGLILVIPLLWDVTAFEVFRGPKREAALVGWTFLAVLFLSANLFNRSCWDRWWAPWAGLLTGGVVSAVVGSNPAHSFLSLVPVALAALGWGAIRQLSAAWRERLAGTVVISGVIQAVLALLFLSPATHPPSWRHLEELSGRFFWLGTMGNPGDVAVFLVLPTILAASLALATRPIRWWPAAAAVLQAAVILATSTLTAIAAVATGLLVLLLRHLPARRRLPAVAIGAALLALLSLASPLRHRVVTEVRTVRQAGWSAAGSYRGAGYAAAAGMLAAHPITGVGFGRYEAHSFQFQSEDVLAERGRTLGLETGFGQAHNDVLQYTAETGLLGLFLAGAGLVIALRSSRSRGVLPDPVPLIAAGVVLALTQFPLHLTAMAVQWTVMAALAVPGLPPTAHKGTWRRRLRVMVILAVTVGAAWIAWQRHLSWRGILWGDRLLRSQHAASEARRERALFGHTVLEPRLRWLPGSWQPLVTLGNLAMEAGAPQRARNHFSRALELADRPEIRFNLGLATIQTGERELGLLQLQRAVELNPRVFAEIRDPRLRQDLRIRLDASGYSQRHPWAFEDTPGD